MCINEEVNNMNSISGFSDSAVKALNSALGAAMGYGHTYVGSEHMLYGLVSDDSFPSASVLRRYGVGRNEVLRRLETLVGKGRPTRLSMNDLTPRSRRLMENALSFAAAEDKRTFSARWCSTGSAAPGRYSRSLA
jgi:ATP-dependent Clp protease ATP-binding subunit ClpA